MPSRTIRIVAVVFFLCSTVIYLYDVELWDGVHIVQQHVSQIGPSVHDQEDYTAMLPSSTPFRKLEQICSEMLRQSPTPSQMSNSAQAAEPRPTRPTRPSDPSTTSSVSPDDILLIIKTGATTIWRRMPMHLTTTISKSRVPNVVVYSDFQERLSSGITTVDVLANETSILQQYDPNAYSAYLDLQSEFHVNTFREDAHLPGDEIVAAGISLGWFLDKYKFLPMLEHAQKNWPGKKWYIYIEDDTFIFLPNLLRYLSNIPHDKTPAYYGSPAGPNNEIFPQGGSGIAFSQSLMRFIFLGPNAVNLEKYANITAVDCCGDIVLGKVLRDYGVELNEGGNGTLSFCPDTPWKTGFDETMWCEKVFSFHHVHAKERVLLDTMEKKYEDAGYPLLFKDVFTELIHPHLNQPLRTNWDNLAAKWVISSGSLPELPSGTDPSAFQNATESPEKCQKACQTLPTCISWKHQEATLNLCALDVVAKLGRETDPIHPWAEKIVVTSGWIMERIETLMNQKCETKDGV